MYQGRARLRTLRGVCDLPGYNMLRKSDNARKRRATTRGGCNLNRQLMREGACIRQSRTRAFVRMRERGRGFGHGRRPKRGRGCGRGRRRRRGRGRVNVSFGPCDLTLERLVLNTRAHWGRNKSSGEAPKKTLV
eukprot:6182754-Pleurochrysis_carterae.AAC.1